MLLKGQSVSPLLIGNGPTLMYDIEQDILPFKCKKNKWSYGFNINLQNWNIIHQYQINEKIDQWANLDRDELSDARFKSQDDLSISDDLASLEGWLV